MRGTWCASKDGRIFSCYIHYLYGGFLPCNTHSIDVLMLSLLKYRFFYLLIAHPPGWIPELIFPQLKATHTTDTVASERCRRFHSPRPRKPQLGNSSERVCVVPCVLYHAVTAFGSNKQECWYTRSRIIAVELGNSKLGEQEMFGVEWAAKVRANIGGCSTREKVTVIDLALYRWIELGLGSVMNRL